jgi:hypothetical protein
MALCREFVRSRGTLSYNPPEVFATQWARGVHRGDTHLLGDQVRGQFSTQDAVFLQESPLDEMTGPRGIEYSPV